MKATYSELSGSRQQLIRLMQWLNFGKIEGLKVKNGEPDWTVTPRFTRIAKMDGEGLPRNEMDMKDFFLKDCHTALFDYLDYVEDGIVTWVDVKHGLPFSCCFEDHLR